MVVVSFPEKIVSSWSHWTFINSTPSNCFSNLNYDDFDCSTKNIHGILQHRECLLGKDHCEGIETRYCKGREKEREIVRRRKEKVLNHGLENLKN